VNHLSPNFEPKLTIIGSRALSFKRPLLSLSVGLFVGLSATLRSNISETKGARGKLLWGAYRKVARGYRMVTSPMMSRDPITS